jgi:6-phosphofructokinase 1
MGLRFERVGILTGGGDVPGLNTTIKVFVRRMAAAGSEVLGLARGWASLLNVSEEELRADWMKPLTRENTRKIDRTGGTMLHSSRLNPALLLPHQVPRHLRGRLTRPDEESGTIDATSTVLEAIDALRLDALVAIGGDGTLSFAKRLHQEGVPVIAIPKTMDNDVHGTEYSIGFSTAVTRGVHAIHDLRTSSGSHERILIVELFGRHSGAPCLLTSYLADADRALIAEVPFDMDRLIGLLIDDKERNPSRYAVLAVSEGAHPIDGRPLESGEPDAVGHRKLGGIGEVISENLRKASGERAMYQILGYMMRSGPPDALDRLVASNFGSLAADLLLAGESGLMTALVGGRYAPVSVERLGEGARRVDVERFYDSEEYRPRISGVKSLPMFLQ